MAPKSPLSAAPADVAARWARTIREHRVAACLSQHELAVELGVTQQAVAAWEAGTAVPQWYNQLELAQVFAVPWAELFAVEP